MGVDPSAYLDTIFTPIQTGLLDLNSFDAEIRILVTSTDTGRFWGIS